MDTEVIVWDTTERWQDSPTATKQNNGSASVTQRTIGDTSRDPSFDISSKDRFPMDASIIEVLSKNMFLRTVPARRNGVIFPGISCSQNTGKRGIDVLTHCDF